MRLAPALLGVLWISTTLPAQVVESTVTRVTGRVVDEAGRPIEGAGLDLGEIAELRTSRALADPAVRTDAAGSFEFRVDSRRGPWSGAHGALIAAKGRASELRRIAVRPGSARLDLGRVRLELRGATLLGRVVDSDGAPIAGALVCATDLLPTMQPLRIRASRGETDANGVFRLACCCPTSVSLAVEADGYYSRTSSPVSLGDPIAVTLERSGFVKCRVVDANGAPAKGHLWMTHENGTIGSFDQTLAVEGAFAFPVRYPGRFRLVAFSDRVGDGSDSPILDGPAAGIELRVGSRAGPKLTVRGRSGADATPISDLRACVEWSTAWPENYQQASFEVTARDAAEDGSVLLRAPAGDESHTGKLLVAAPGFARKFDVVVWAESGSTLTVDLDAESVAHGRVRGIDGAPLPSTSVGVYRTKSMPTPEWMDRLAIVLTDEDGAFRFGELAAGDYTLVIRSVDGRSGASHRIQLGVGEVGASIEVTIDRSARARGVVRGLRRPARLAVVPAEATPWSVMTNYPYRLDEFATPTAEIAADGSFALDGFELGRYSLTLLYDSSSRGIEPLRVAAGQRVLTAEGEIEIDAAALQPGAITGELHMAGALVPFDRMAVLVRQKAQRGVESGGDRVGLIARDGSFACEVAPGDHEVFVVDVLTGVVLHEVDDTQSVVSGRERGVEISLRAAECHVTLVPPTDARLIARRLQIAGALDFEREPRIALDTSRHGTAGIDLAEARTDHVFFVPEGQLSLNVERGATAMSRGRTTWRMESLGSAAVMIESRVTPYEVRIDVAAPGPLD